MSQLSPLALTNAANSTVTFTPRKGDKGDYSFSADDGNFGLSSSIREQLRDQSNKAFRARTTIEVPVVETVDGKQVQTDTHLVEINFRVSPRATPEDALAFLESYVGSSAYKQMITSREFKW